MKIKKQNMRDLFQCEPALLTAAEGGMIENHRRVNETGQAMNEATACLSLSPLFLQYELLYHDKRQDRCK